jgi:hypothetical protein
MIALHQEASSNIPLQLETSSQVKAAAAVRFRSALSTERILWGSAGTLTEEIPKRDLRRFAHGDPVGLAE